MSSKTGSGTTTGRSLSAGNGGRERTKTEGEEGERERQHVFPLTTTGGALPHPVSQSALVACLLAVACC